MALTVREKEHWKDRIEVRINKKIERIQQDHPVLVNQVERQSLVRAEEAFGIVELRRELNQLNEQLSTIEDRRRDIERAMLAKVRGVSVKEAQEISTYYCGQEVDKEIKKRQKRYTDELLAESEVGKELLKLKEQKENLLDVVWLATSPSQIKTLWSDVLSLLEDTPSQLEQQVLNIEPLSDN